MIGTTLGYDGLGSLVIFTVGERAPDRDEWLGYVGFIKERVATHGKVRLVVVAGSAGPDAVQRKQLGDAVTPRQLKTAVVSDSMVARGIVTAFRWYGLDLDAFKTSEMDKAFRFVGVSSEEIEWANRTLAAIRSSLAIPRAASR